MKEIKTTKNLLSPISIEITIICLLGGFTFFIAQYYDAFEYLVEISRKYEKYEVDELFTLLIILFIALIFIVFRKNKYLKLEIAKRKAAEESIKKIAFYDCLTGLPNRDLCMNRFENMLLNAARTSSVVAILFIDLDDFKKVNDTYGHDCGDTLLKQVTHRLLKRLRKGDTLSRFAGDEFIILLESIGSRDNVVVLTKELINCLRLPFKIKTAEIQIGISIGIAMSPNDGQDAAMLLKYADMAMYQAKREGKNTYRFYRKEFNMEQSVK